MKTIGFTQSLPIHKQNSLVEFETEKPKPEGRDLLVKVQAVSVNPVDVKVRIGAATDTVLEEPRILGWDAVGIVEAVAENVSIFKKGDAVFYAGDITRPGSNAEYQLVDERIVGKKPRKLSNAEAAAMPLTSITAWESIFDRLNIQTGAGQDEKLLIIGGAGGVGSIATQLAKKMTNLTVMATASRDETIEWCRKMGADHVVNHRDLIASVRALGIEHVDYILCLNNTEGHWQNMATLIKPQGRICSIVESVHPLDLNLLKDKSVRFTWEFMFTRSMHQTDDMIDQHKLLNRVSELMDNGQIRTTLTTTLRGLGADTFKQAHEKIESGKMVGKLVVLYE